MHDEQQSTRFDALEKATTAAGIAISLVLRVPTPLKPIADQVIRSASSVPAYIAEGAGRSGRDRLHYYRIAYGYKNPTRCAKHIICSACCPAPSTNVPAGQTSTRGPAVRGAVQWRCRALHGKRVPGRLSRLRRRPPAHEQGAWLERSLDVDRLPNFLMPDIPSHRASTGAGASPNHAARASLGRLRR